MRCNWFHCLFSAVAIGYLVLPTMSVIASSAETPAGYQLGAQDKIAIRVYEWRPSRDEIYEWVALKAEHTIDGSGSLSLPLVGEIRAKGMTTTELAQDIGERLKQRMGLADRPDISIEVVQFRPFYVVGAISKPGEYPYRPGLTVLKAYAIAGGHPHSDGPMRLEREAISTRGEIHSFDLEAQTLMLRIARLQAELNGAPSVEWPAELKLRLQGGPLGRVAEQEELLFRTRMESFHTQISALENLQTFLEGEVRSLEKQVSVHEIEVASVKEESKIVSDLYKKGLTINSRKMALERNVAQVDGDRLRLQAGLMRARQEVSKTKISIIDLSAKRSSEISAELQAAQSKLEAVRGKSQTARDLLFETENVAPQIYADAENGQQLQPSFKIMRDGQAFDAGDATAVEPGDTLVVSPPVRRRPAGVDVGEGRAEASNVHRLTDLMK
jgi:hypothetical protein